jgi:hypothetical protein
MAISGAIHGTAGAAAASLAAIQAPVGVLFGTTYFAVSHLASYGWGLLEKTSRYPFNHQMTEHKIFKLALATFSGMAAAVWTTSLIHISLTVSAAAVMSAAMAATTATVGLLMCAERFAKNIAIGPNIL